MINLLIVMLADDIAAAVKGAAVSAVTKGIRYVNYCNKKNNGLGT